MYAEEQFLYWKFGVKFSNWAKEVPAFIPKMSGLNRAELSFSWKKVLKKEKKWFLGPVFSHFFI